MRKNKELPNTLLKKHIELSAYNKLSETDKVKVDNVVRKKERIESMKFSKLKHD